MIQRTASKGAEMPWSWVRVSTGTSPKLKRCIGTDTSSGKARDCVTDIVTGAGGEVGELHFEANGKWARLRFKWANVHIKRDVIYDLQAEDVIDVLEDDERDELLPRDDS
jgi:hypothetical protein